MNRMPKAGRALRALLPLAATLATILAGCGLYQPVTTEDREARASCRADADRVFAARNRYQMSERDQTATPNGGSALGGVPSAGLSDQYEQEQMVDTCLARSGAGQPATPESNTATTNPPQEPTRP